MDVLGVLLEQDGVVRHAGLYEFVFIRLLSGGELPVDEEPLHPGVAHAARVAREVHALGEIVDAAQAALERLELIFRELRRFVDEYGVVLLPLIPEHVPLRGAVAVPDVRAVREQEPFLVVVPPRNAVELRLHGQDVVLQELGVCAADYEYVDAGIPAREQHRLLAYGPGFPAAVGAPVGDKPPAGLEEELLPLVEPEAPSLHIPRPPRRRRRRTQISRRRPRCRSQRPLYGCASARARGW